MIKYVVRMMMNTGNVESILLLFIVREKYVQVEFCYKLHIGSAVVLVELCPL